MNSTKHIINTTVAILKDNLRNRFALFWIIFFPVILAILFPLVFGGIGNAVHVTVDVNGYNAQEIAESLNESNIFSGVTGISYQQAMKQGFIYVNVTNNGNEINVYTNLQDKPLIPSLKALIEEAILKPNVNFSSQVTSSYTFSDYLISGIIGIVSLSNGLFGLIGIASGYYRDRIVERLAASPLRSIEWSISLILYVVIITIISTSAVLLAGIVFGFIPIANIAFLGFLIVSTMMFGALGAVIYGLTPKEKLFVAQSVVSALIFPLMFLSNAFFPVSAFPSIIRPFVEYQPLSLIDSVIRDLTIYGVVPNLTLVGSIIAITIVLNVIAGRLLRLRETGF
jgi:ABC-2 type transport system permease protein